MVKRMMSSNLPKSALIVLEGLTVSGPMSPKDISEKTKLAPRTVSFALRKLLGWRLCRKVPNLSDMRQPLYLANPEMARNLLRKYGMDICIR
jgi:DNA-binding transcriptional regulator GbsR (MarR family)